MDLKTKEMYSEVYSILKIMDEKYVKRLPESLYELIKNNRLETYNPTYAPSENIVNQNISKETATMLILLKLNYWCDSEDEKEEIRASLKHNSDEHSRMMREKYSSANIFKQINESKPQAEIEEKKEEIVKYKEEGVFKKILNKILSFIGKK